MESQTIMIELRQLGRLSFCVFSQCQSLFDIECHKPHEFHWLYLTDCGKCTLFVPFHFFTTNFFSAQAQYHTSSIDMQVPECLKLLKSLQGLKSQWKSWCRGHRLGQHPDSCDGLVERLMAWKQWAHSLELCQKTVEVCLSLGGVLGRCQDVQRK